MDIIDAYDVRGLHGPIKVIGFNFYTDRPRLAELLSLELSQKPPRADHMNLIDSEAPNFCANMEDMSTHLRMLVEAERNEGNDPGVWVLYRSGVLLGCLEGVSVSFKLLDPPCEEWGMVYPEEDVTSCSTA